MRSVLAPSIFQKRPDRRPLGFLPCADAGAGADVFEEVRATRSRYADELARRRTATRHSAPAVSDVPIGTGVLG